MNLRDLQYLIAVADTLHFGRAAERCFVSQPTLSGQIKKLEDELAVTLFERTKRSVVITPIGAEILKHAKLVVEQTDAIVQLARAQRDPLAGPVRLGVIPTISPYLMPLILMPLRQNYPQTRLILSEEITDILLQRLAAHQIDAAIIATPIDDGEFDQIALFEEPFWLAHPRSHALYTKEEITAEDLAGLDLLLLADGHCLASQVMDVCGMHQRDNEEMGDLRAASLETLLQLVGAGFGCTLVPALAIRGPWMTDSGIIARPLDMPDARRTVRMVYRKTFPRRHVLEVIADVIWGKLPNTVRSLRPRS